MYELDISAVVDSCFEVHKHKFNNNMVILLLDFFRVPELICTMQLLQDIDGDSILSPLYKRRIYRDKKGFYFKLDGEKYHLKHNLI